MSDGRWQAMVSPAWDLAAWRDLARRAWEAEVPPERIDWGEPDQPGLLPSPPLAQAAARRSGLTVPAGFLDLAGRVLCHRDPGRHGLLYRVLWRIGAGERGLLERATDPDIHRLGQMAREVGRDVHKMKAFVRFRAVPGQDDAYAAWFEPAHFIVDRVAPFFVRRFAGMRFSILTPCRSVVWDGHALWLGGGGERSQVPAADAGEDLWRTYYASIFNPARLNTRMMRQEMPQKYWHLLPETHLLPDLVRGAGARVEEMARREAQAPRRRIPARRRPPRTPPGG